MLQKVWRLGMLQSVHVLGFLAFPTSASRCHRPTEKKRALLDSNRNGFSACCGSSVSKES